MNTYPLFPTRPSLCLDGVWDFSWLSDDQKPLADIDATGIVFNEHQAVPGVFDTDVKRYGKRGVGFYRKQLAFACAAGQPLRLRIGGLGLAAKFWFDGQLIASSELAYSSFNIDFNASLAGSTHELIIAVDNRFKPQATPIFAPFFDFYGYGGIYRSVELQALPAAFIERAQVTTLDATAGKIRLSIELGGAVPATFNGTVAFDGSAAQGLSLPVQDGRAVTDLLVPNARLWSPDSPNLHTVTISNDTDCITERFGLRTLVTNGERIVLNGKPLTLKGVNRHESHPEFGPVQNPHLIMGDLLLLKNMGANFVRCVHYPQDQMFFDICDEVGMLAWQESMGWNNTEPSTKDPHFFALQVEQTRLMVNNGMNHPSIILWGFLNECCSETAGGRVLYQTLADTIRQRDPKFLVTYACNRTHANPDGTPADICFDLCDVVAFNTYPGWIGGKCTWLDESASLIAPEIIRIAALAQQPALKGKPAIMSEMGCCALYGFHDMANAQWAEEYQADYVSEVCRQVFGNGRFMGLAIWQFCDTRSYVNAAPGVRSKPRGFNCAGLVDEYRRPKLSYWAIQKLYRDLP